MLPLLGFLVIVLPGT